MTKKILFITLSNIGDCILTLPVLDALRNGVPAAKITVLASLRSREIFQDNPAIERLIIYDKHSPLREKIRLFGELKKQRFDTVVDLRNGLWGVFLGARKKTSLFLAMPRQLGHMKDRHLYKLSALGYRPSDSIERGSFYIKPEDEEYVRKILKDNNIKKEERIIVVAPGARSHTKRWAQDKFRELIAFLVKEYGAKIVLVGDKEDVPITSYIAKNCSAPILDLSAKTTLAQLACLLKMAQAVVTNDSATLHLASYLNRPVVGIFGPTSEIKYGPWSDQCAVVKKDIFCRPCEKAQCKFGTLECLQLVKVENVLSAVRDLLFTDYRLPITDYQKPKRILVVRTDRIGDVLLSTPVVRVLRDNYPCAYIATMVSPYARDIVDGNPYLDEVIIYDKEAQEKGWLGSMKFAQDLKKKRFDLALILHPANRVHLVTFLAGIPKRVGYDRKMGFLLTDKIRHTKQAGEKHEREYALDLVRYLGIEPRDNYLFMPIKPESEEWAQGVFRQEGIVQHDKILAIHPGASCPSKIWPSQRFAEAADKLIERYGFKVLLVSGPKDKALAEKVIENMRHPAINLAGRTSVSQLASVLKRCRLFISNDSGPVHIASSLGTPVISIFGRNQKGLSPLRWGPVGKKDKVLHKEVGCIECLAHNCTKSFLCLQAISVDDVVNAAEIILK